MEFHPLSKNGECTVCNCCSFNRLDQLINESRRSVKAFGFYVLTSLCHLCYIHVQTALVHECPNPEKRSDVAEKLQRLRLAEVWIIYKWTLFHVLDGMRSESIAKISVGLNFIQITTSILLSPFYFFSFLPCNPIWSETLARGNS